MSKRTPTPRNIRLSDQIKREISLLLIQQIKDPRVRWVQITDLDLTPDYAHATVLFSVLDSSKFSEALKGLNSCAGFLRKEIGKRIVMHTLPQLHFKADHSQMIQQEMNQLIHQAIEKTHQSEQKNTQPDVETAPSSHT
jgi:ribosome-binding factor A